MREQILTEEGVEVDVVVNGSHKTVLVRPDRRLVDAIRDDFGLRGTKIGCGTGHCGACSVLLDDEVVCSCLVLAAECHGSEVVTIEGLGDPDTMNPVQAALVESTTVQCGYCTPGIVVVATALLRELPNPSETEVRQALVGNLCRCTGYQGYVRSIMNAAGASSHAETRA